MRGVRRLVHAKCALARLPRAELATTRHRMRLLPPVNLCPLRTTRTVDGTSIIRVIIIEGHDNHEEGVR